MLKRFVLIMLALTLLASPLSALAENHAIAYMDSCFECGCRRGGTGAMIGPRGLLTAGHNLYCPDHGQKLTSCDFYFGAESANKYFYRYEGHFQYTVYDTFENGYSAENDIGYVIFESEVGRKTGWMGTQVGEDYYLHEEFINVNNYDANRNLQYAYDVGYVYSDKQMYIPVRFSGTDGGPVYTYMYGFVEHDYPAVVAVYTSFDNAGNSYARRLTQDVFNDLKADGAFEE
ncbi:MAG: hypothetical protein IJ507_02840 [Clostridia bacterium]|nr:hypothetical protein [Clostridia bacterium]